VAVNTVQASPLPDLASGGDVASALEALALTRERTLALVAHLDARQLERVHSPIMGPLVWDLAHIAAYEDVWLCHRHAGLDLLRPDLAPLYDAFETPRSSRRQDAAKFLDTPEAYSYLEQVHERACTGLQRRGLGDGSTYELVLRHELQHNETMRQTMNIAGLLPRGEPPMLPVDAVGSLRAPGDGPARGDGEPGEWTELPAGRRAIGAGPEGFAYDNERPRHTVELAPFAIATRPLSNAAWMRFREEGGYERRELWSEEGWRWLRERGREDRDFYAQRAGRNDPGACLCHVSWFEADALARASGARLPTETEWETAARARALAAVGLVWEWTSSVFTGFPGFRAHPYREYSEVFFDRGYRVLRGSSWATHERVASNTFRNWDLPERLQIFAGVRLARDL
jgi:gamma-glutamyl hercynylcysteine S-oxide synthase